MAGNWNRPEPRALTAIIVIVTLGFRGLGYRVLFVDDVFYLLAVIDFSFMAYLQVFVVPDSVFDFFIILGMAAVWGSLEPFCPICASSLCPPTQLM